MTLGFSPDLRLQSASAPRRAAVLRSLRATLFTGCCLLTSAQAIAQYFPSTVPIGPSTSADQVRRQATEQAWQQGSVAPAAGAPIYLPQPAASANPYALPSVPVGVNGAAQPATYGSNTRDTGNQPRLSMAEGEPWKAVQNLSEQARLNPFDPIALNNLAVARAAQGELQAAMQLLERAVKLAPNRADIANNLNNLRAWYEQGVPNFTARSVELDLPRAEGALPPIPALWPQAMALAEKAATPNTVVSKEGASRSLPRLKFPAAQPVKRAVSVTPVKRSSNRTEYLQIEALTTPLSLDSGRR
ncbi:tetratricopeptide repeat protein [Parvibium lacunae]|uniref:Uncharacterized protein n=1 Tax=Parvibium lacunae TaxID=1888893 RepID=A0A368L817_9BURK|nr:hypothetical protein [Parvibium lacunae]RCS59803.1 hypothetical protein DU000_03620 [Parvibium lacunae]